MDAEPPKNPWETCRNCGKDVTASQGETVCPFCGNSLVPSTAQGMSRGKLWALFWAIFLGTPVLTIVSFRWSPALGLAIPVIGLLGAGGILSKLYIKSPAGRVVMTFVFAVSLLIVYGGIAFAGCLIATNGKGF